VLGRKRVPEEGMFWKSVSASTGQPIDLVNMPARRASEASNSR
jgi:hypothetical protein